MNNFEYQTTINKRGKRELEVWLTQEKDIYYIVICQKNDDIESEDFSTLGDALCWLTEYLYEEAKSDDDQQ